MVQFKTGVCKRCNASYVINNSNIFKRDEFCDVCLKELFYGEQKMKGDVLKNGRSKRLI